MKKATKYAGAIVAAIIITVIVLYSNSYIGISLGSIERDARVSQKIPDDWQAAEETTEAMSAMIFFSDDHNDHTYSLYVNRPGLSFGYFFSEGGSLGEGIAEFHIEGYSERAFISMNEQKVNKS